MSDDDLTQADIFVTVDGSVSGNPKVTVGSQTQYGAYVTFSGFGPGSYSVDAEETIIDGTLRAHGSATVSNGDTKVYCRIGLN